ncbi:MAG: restriction endonuclease subunit S [Lacipirellulaceae bacterium]
MPNHWQVARIDDFAKRGTGHTPNKSLPHYWNGGIPWVSLADSDRLDRVYLDDTAKKISAEGIQHSSAVLHPEGIVLLSRDAGVGKSAITTRPMAVSQHFVVWQCGPQLVSLYLYYWLQLLKPEFDSIANGSTIKTIGMPYFAELGIMLPSRCEQEKIAGILATWDRGIRQLTDLIAAKVRYKQGLMQQLLTGKRRFKGFHDEWRDVRIGDVAEEVSQRNGHTDGVVVLSCTKHDGLVNSFEYFGRRVHSEDTSNYKVVRRGEFAYATNHIEEGSIGLLTHVDAGLVSPMYTVFRTNSDVVPEYLFRALKTETYRQVFQSFTSASVNRRGSLRWKQFATIPLKLPSVVEQKRIDTLLATFDREIDILRRQLEALKQQKRGLMQKLLTGEVRVPLKKERA